MKKILISILVLLIVFAVSFKFYKKGYIFSYASPYNNTSVFPYIAKSSRQINSILYKALDAIKKNNSYAHIIFVNGYGSGFIKGNKSSSDYDYSAAINLGRYKYDGNNEFEIAKDILEQIQTFQTSVYDIAEKDPSFEIASMDHNERYGTKNSTHNIQLVGDSIKKAIEGKPYSVLLRGRVFQLLEKEIIQTKYALIRLYSRDISYSKDFRKMLRELTTACEFYVDIETDNGVETYELVTEVSEGRRDSQKKHAKFVPSIFTDFNSIKFAHQFYDFKDDEDYLTLRMASYCSHYMDPEFLNLAGSYSPIKVAKRLLQSVYIIYPILEKKSADKMITEASKVLHDGGIIALNDYNVVVDTVKDSTKTPKTMKKFSSIIRENLIAGNHILKDLEEKYGYTKEELKPLTDFQEFMFKALKNRDAMQPKIKDNIPTHYIYQLIANHIENKKELFECRKELDKLFETAGVHRIQIWQNHANHVYVIKDDFTKNIKENEFIKLKPINGFQVWTFNDDTTFEFMEMKDFHHNLRNIQNCWVRYNSTDEEDAVWEEMQKKLLKDKRNYHLKFRFGLSKI